MIRNDSQEEFKQGTWRTPTTTRTATGRRSAASTPARTPTCSHRGTFTASSPRCCATADTACSFFAARSGNEEDAVTARTFYTALELWSGTYYVPSGDPNCFDNTGQAIAIFYRPTPPGYDIVGWLQFVGETDLFQATGICNGNSLTFSINPACGALLTGTIVGGSTLNPATTCCWYCPSIHPDGADVLRHHHGHAEGGMNRRDALSREVFPMNRTFATIALALAMGSGLWAAPVRPTTGR